MRTEKLPLREEAEICRRKALAYIGLPEATFLMRAAQTFDDLASAEGFHTVPTPAGRSGKEKPGHAEA